MSAFIFVEVCSYTCCPISVVSNLVLLWIIRNNASRHLSPYKSSLSIMAFIDIVVSILFVLCQPCALVDDKVVLTVLLGPTASVHNILASICFVIFLSAFILCTLQVASPCFFRFFAHKKNNVPCQVGAVALAVGLIGLLIVAPLVFLGFRTASNNTIKVEHFQRVVREFSRRELPPHFVAYELDVLGKLWLVFLVVVCSIGSLSVAVSIVLSSGLVTCTKWVKYSNARFGEIAYAIRVTACCAAVMVVTPLALFTIFAVLDRPIRSYSIPLFLGNVFLSILNPYLIIFNVRTYRKDFISIVSLKSKTIGPISYLSSDH